MSSTVSSALSAHLDSLLSQYLTLLSAHQELFTSAQTIFHSGLFSLAEANFRSPNRTRYGQDLYSNKMQASLILNQPEPNRSPSMFEEGDAETPPSDEMKHAFEFRRLPTAAHAKRAQKSASADSETPCGAEESESKDLTSDGTTTHVHDTDIQLPTPLTSRDVTPAVHTGDSKTNAQPPSLLSSSSSSIPREEQEQDLPADPIRQFGILVPPALRAAQGSFARAAEEWIESVQRDRQMEALELEIRRVRKRLRKAEGGTDGKGEV